MSKILIVDSDRRKVHDIDTYITQEGCTTYFAKTTSAAMDELEKHEIDIVVVDMMAPKMTGLTILSIVTENYPCVPVVLITDASSVEEAKAAVREDAFDYLVEPITKERLLSTLRSAMQHRQAFSETPSMASAKLLDFDQMEAMGQYEGTALYNAISGTFQAIGHILDLKDPLAAGHELKVAGLVLSIAKKMGLSQHQQDCVYFSSFLHDIGKLMIPSEILSKPGKLTPCEYNMVKDHVIKGHALIKGIKLPWPVQDVVFQHHERLDGSGYPKGLVGDEIMIEARVVAVADVIEAMTSYRPYRPRFDIRVALNEITKNAGTLYDPDVCDAVVSLFREDHYRIDNASAS